MNKLLKLTYLLIFSSAFTAFGQVIDISAGAFLEDFESQGNGPTTCGSNYTFTGNTWQNGDDPALALPLSTTHQNDWTVNDGPTGSSTTGPSVDHTLGTNLGKYTYTEASGCFNMDYELISPYMDLTSVVNPQFELWYNAFGSTMGTLYIEAVVGANGSWTTLDSLTDNIDLWQMYSLSLAAYSGSDSLRLRLRCITGSNFYSDFALDDIKVFDLQPLNAGIISIDSPTNPVIAGPNNIDVTIENFGSDTLTSATIEWSAGGVVQTPYAWSGNIGYLQTDPVVNIGSYNFPNGLTKVKAWTSMPNGMVDPANGDDTTEFLFCTPLIGAYTVGGAGADFTDLTELGDILSSCGVGGNVVVTVNPGAYTGRMILDHVPGTSASATVVINGIDTSLVSLTNAQFSNIYVDGSDYITIKNITLINSGIIDSYGIQLRDTAMNNSFDSLRILLSTATGLSDVIGVSGSDTETSSYSEGQNALYTMVSNCYIHGGEKGIHFEGQNALRTIGNKFHYNTIDEAEDYGFYIDDQDSMEIIGNTITDLRTSASADAFYIFDVQMFDISYNTAMDVPDWGFYIADGNYNLDGTPASRGRISNNMISSQSDYAAYFDDFEQTDLWHNTFYGNPGIRINDVIDLDVRNNIFMSDIDYAFEDDDDLYLGPPMTVDYNNYWTPSTNTLFVKDGTAIHADLTAWQTAQPTANMNASEVDPVFLMGSSDMHVLSPGINDTGDNTVGITDDIDGDARPAGTNVDMGADEFTPTANDLWLVSYIFSEPCGDSLTPIYMVVTNIGSNPVTSFDATANITGDATSTINYTYSGNINFNETDTVLIGTVNTYWGEDFYVNGWVNLAGDANNSNDTLSGSFYNIPYQPIGYDAYACGDTSVWVFAEPVSGATYNWFATSDQVNDTIPLATSDSLFVPNVLTQGTYYVEYANNQDSLLTTMAGGNGCGSGNMFDMTALNAINWTGVDVNCSSVLGAAVTVNVYYIPGGTFNGNETNAAAWTTLGSFNATSAGSGAMTYVDFGTTTLNIPAGSTYAIYVEFPANYTNGAFTYANSDVSITTGIGLCSAFGGTNNPRSFNGQIHYGSTACSNIRVPVNVSMGTFADPAFTSSATGNVVDFTSSGATQNIGYAWNFGDGSPVDTNANPTHTFTVDSTYYVCLTATSASCGDTTYCDSIDVCATMTPAIGFDIAGDGYIYNFMDNTTGTPTGWMWDFGDGNTSTSQNPSNTYPSIDSTYTVTLTVTNYCGDTVTTSQVINVVSIDELSLGELINISPNPSQGLFTIDFEGNGAGTTLLTVVDLQGRVVLSDEFNTEDKWTKSIDLRNYENGIYILKVVQNNSKAEFQLVKTAK